MIRHRLLINRLADPSEVGPRLPDGVRPHVTSSGGVVVGCCLIAIDAARPWPLPATVGQPIRAAAHRISVEVGPIDAPTTAVYVPRRHTDGLAPVVFGGRVFPGVHDRADITMSRTDAAVAWSVAARGSSGPGVDRFDIAVDADLTCAVACDSELAQVVIGTIHGLSPGRRPDSLEAADMCPAVLDATRVELHSIRSAYLDSFRTAVPAETLFMADVGVTWRRAPALVAAG